MFFLIEHMLSSCLKVLSQERLTLLQSLEKKINSLAIFFNDFLFLALCEVIEKTQKLPITFEL